MSEYSEIEKMLEEFMEDNLETLNENDEHELETFLSDSQSHPSEEDDEFEIPAFINPQGPIREAVQKKVMHDNFVLLAKGLDLSTFFELNPSFRPGLAYLPRLQHLPFLSGLVSEEMFLELLGIQKPEDIFASQIHTAPGVIDLFRKEEFSPDSLRNFLESNFKKDYLFPFHVMKLCFDASEELANIDPIAYLVKRALSGKTTGKNSEGDFIFSFLRWIAYVMMLEPVRNSHF